jgi:hypothetical protein
MQIEHIPETLSELQAWATDYENQFMKSTEASHRLAETTIALILYHLPSILKPITKRIIVGFMDDHLRTAMMYPLQPAWVYHTINWFFILRKTFLRNVCLPRIKPMMWTADKPNEFGRYNLNWAYLDVCFITSVLIVALVFKYRWTDPSNVP